MESGILWDPCYKERVYITVVREKSVLASSCNTVIKPLRYVLHFIWVQIRVLVIPVKMAPRTAKRSTVKTQSKRKGKGSSVKRKPKRKNQKGGFIFTPFVKIMDNALDYDRRQQRARKRGKKFKKKKATDDIWQFLEKNLQ